MLTVERELIGIDNEVRYDHNLSRHHIIHMNSWRFIIGVEMNTFSIAICKTFANKLAVKFWESRDNTRAERVSNSRHSTGKS